MRAGIHMPDVRHIVRFEIGVNSLTESDQTVFVAAGYPQQLEFLRRFGRFRNQLFGRARVRGGRESAYPCERVQMAQPEVQRLPAAHRQSGKRPVCRPCFYWIVRFHERKQVFEQIEFKGFKGFEVRVDIALRPVVRLCPSIRQDDEHGREFAVRVEIIQNDVGLAVPLLFVFIAADAVQ